MFGFDDALMAAFAEEAAMTEGVNTALAAQQSAEAAAALEAAQAAAATQAAMQAATATQAGAAGAAGQGITQAGMASNVLGGGAGAGAAGINPAMVAQQQGIASAIPNSGLAQIPQNQAFIDAFSQGVQNAPSMAGPGVDIASATGGPEFLPKATSMPTGVPEGYQGNVARASMNYIDPVDSLRPTISSAPPESDLLKGFNDFIDKNPKTAAAGAYLTAYHSGLLDPRTQHFGGGNYSGSLSSYRMSPAFQGRYANPTDYQPKRFQSGGIADITGGRMPVEQMSNANAVGMNTGFPQADISGHAYATPWQTPVSQNVVQGAADTGVNRMDDNMLATGGIVGYARGGDTSKALDFYRQMYDPSSEAGTERVAAKGDPGIYYDLDPDTRYQDALTAAQIRNAKVAKRANMQMPTSKRPTPMGSLNLRPPGAEKEQAQSSLDPENAAHGGIMQARHSTLGGYAAGGNPRLLKGPGDGMSDNIPATIAGKQPARLADGEFVIPADVVSHLGNGSTDAGAKKLHHMMDNVRKARTGRKSQGKQINPDKFMPK